MSVKYDSGKIRPSLVLLSMSRALQSVSEVATFGADKYTDDGWCQVPDGVKRYTDAMLRHMLAEASGEVNDPESGLPHAAHIAWNALARLDLEQRLRQALGSSPPPDPPDGVYDNLPTIQFFPGGTRIPDGIYDNHRTMRRETYLRGVMVEDVARALVDDSCSVAAVFGSFPDLPK